MPPLGGTVFFAPPGDKKSIVGGVGNIDRISAVLGIEGVNGSGNLDDVVLSLCLTRPLKCARGAGHEKGRKCSDNKHYNCQFDQGEGACAFGAVIGSRFSAIGGTCRAT